MFAIHPEPMYYDWGDSSLFSTFFGRSVPEALQLAELWMGAHPKAPSRLADPHSQRSLRNASDLRDILRRHPAECLGNSGFGQELPYLLKILSAAKALSIQVHPDLDQAREGFERENSLGIPLSASDRNYKDPNHKPECIFALSEMYALQGFREPADIREALDPARAYLGRPLAELEKVEAEQALAGFLEKSLSIDPEDLEAALMELGQKAREELEANPKLPPEHPHRWFLQMSKAFPGDSGLLAAYYLNVVRLLPGQTLFLEARMLHAYLSGIGVELMASSDNVLRAGCTSKHIDTDELLKVTRTAPGKGRILELLPGEWLDAGYNEFRLFVGPKEENQVLTESSPRMLLSLDARIKLTYLDPPRKDTSRLAREAGFVKELLLAPGQAAFLPANLGSIELSLLGSSGKCPASWVMAAPGLG